MSAGPGRRGGAAARRRNGFTLLELLVVLALLGLLAALCLPLIGHGGGAVLLSADARVLAARLRAGRELALATREASVVTIDLGTPGVSGPGDQPFYRFRGVDRLDMTGGGREEGAARILFAAGGGSSGGDVVLHGGGLSRIVHVHWLTGAVSVREAAP